MILLLLILYRIILIRGHGLLKLEFKFKHYQVWIHVTKFKTSCLPVCGRTL